MRDIGGIAGRTSVLVAAAAYTAAPVSVAPLGPSARFSLRVDRAIATTLGAQARLRLDVPINTSAAAGEWTIARLGLDEWMVLGPENDNEAIDRAITTALAGHFFSLVDIGHRDVAISVGGSHAREVVNGGCPLDLDDSAFPPGSATRTLLGKAGIVLMRPGSERIYRVETGRSYAPYVHALLNDVAREFEGI